MKVKKGTFNVYSDYDALCKCIYRMGLDACRSDIQDAAEVHEILSAPMTTAHHLIRVLSQYTQAGPKKVTTFLYLSFLSC